MSMTDAQWAGTIRATLEREIAVGGELKELPCPFCKLPRCERSDYIRCSKCGVNWLRGEDLSRDPRVDRFKRVVSSMTKAVAPAEKMR